jgi:hypothetical protein
VLIPRSFPDQSSEANSSQGVFFSSSTLLARAGKRGP